MKNILPLLLLVLSTKTFSQIQLPHDFRCVPGINHANESYFKNGEFTFRTYPYGHDLEDESEAVEAVETNTGLKLQKTKDGIYWASGKVRDRYVYTVLVGMTQLTLGSKTNNSDFSYYSTWLLKQVRENIAVKKDLYFTDYAGKSCFEMK